MALTPDVWEDIRRGNIGQTDAHILEVICSVGRQLAYRLERLIDVLERGPAEKEEALVAPTTGPGAAYTPVGRMVELLRLQLASYPRDHQVQTVTAAGVMVVSNTRPYSIALLITNEDNAQKLYYGAAPATTTNAPIIEPETSKKIILSPNADLYCRVIGADITVAISNLDLPTV